MGSRGEYANIISPIASLKYLQDYKYLVHGIYNASSIFIISQLGARSLCAIHLFFVSANYFPIGFGGENDKHSYQERERER